MRAAAWPMALSAIALRVGQGHGFQAMRAAAWPAKSVMAGNSLRSNTPAIFHLLLVQAALADGRLAAIARAVPLRCKPSSHDHGRPAGHIFIISVLLIFLRVLEGSCLQRPLPTSLCSWAPSFLRRRGLFRQDPQARFQQHHRARCPLNIHHYIWHALLQLSCPSITSPCQMP